MHFFLKKETADSAEDKDAVATADIAGITTSGTVTANSWQNRSHMRGDKK
jgi:hypothetical protein